MKEYKCSCNCIRWSASWSVLTRQILFILSLSHYFATSHSHKLEIMTHLTSHGWQKTTIWLFFMAAHRVNLWFKSFFFSFLKKRKKKKRTKKQICSFSLQGDKGPPGPPGPPVSSHCAELIIQKLSCVIQPDLSLSIIIIMCCFYHRDKRESQESRVLMEHQERMALM